MAIDFEQRAEALRHAPGLVLFPPVLGTGIIIAVLSGLVTPQILDSGAAMVAALAVGCLLILVPPAVYASWPEAIDEYYGELKGHLDGDGSRQADQTPAIAPSIDAGGVKPRT